MSLNTSSPNIATAPCLECYLMSMTALLLFHRPGIVLQWTQWHVLCPPDMDHSNKLQNTVWLHGRFVVCQTGDPLLIFQHRVGAPSRLAVGESQVPTHPTQPHTSNSIDQTDTSKHCFNYKQVTKIVTLPRAVIWWLYFYKILKHRNEHFLLSVCSESRSHTICEKLYYIPTKRGIYSQYICV